MVPVTRQELIDHADAIKQLLESKSVQAVWMALEEIYFREWKAAKTVEDRESIRSKVDALGDLKQKLEQAVASGQHEAYLAAKEERDAQAGHQH